MFHKDQLILMIINKIKKTNSNIIKSKFNRNVLTLMTGTAIAQALPIAITPLLTRIYTPEDFGVFALFIAIVTIFGQIINGRYELAIMLPKKDEDAINIFALGFVITSILSLVFLILILIFKNFIITFFENDEIGKWLFLTPISIFFIGVWNLLNYFNIRKQNYKDISKATIIKSVILSISQITIGFIKSGVVGLISGHIISQLFANTKLILNI
jgi:O-antigen/teichoic acid export membrane protein